MRIALAVLATMLGACLTPALVECVDGLVCPSDSVCDVEGRRCVRQDQLDACRDLAPLADCQTPTLTGGCFDGVCLPRGCGNAILEGDELCDDGNQTSGDGCRNDCASVEQCGDGAVDGALGEVCDDGNRVSHDGCDSGCTAEAPLWDVVPLLPHCLSGAYHEARSRYVCTTSDSLWEFDGQRWELVAATVPGQLLLYYDTVAQQIGGVARADGAAWSWDGTTWTPRAAGFAAPVVAVVFDEARATLVAVASDLSTRWLDGAASWQIEPGPVVEFEDFYIFGISLIRAVFDPTTQAIHLTMYIEGYNTTCQDGCDARFQVSWTRSPTGTWVRTNAPYDQAFLAVDRRHRRLVSSGVDFFGLSTSARVDVSRLHQIVGGIATQRSTAPELANITAIAAEPTGAVIAASVGDARVYRIAPDGSASPIIGTGSRGFSGDGGPALAAELAGPRAITTDASGNIYLADGWRVRRVDSAGIITTIAGTGAYGSTGDGGPAIAATFSGIEQLAVDPQGRLLIAEYDRLRRIDAGVITTVAVGILARCLVAEPDGSIVVCEQHRIKRIAPGGATSTIAGTGVAGYAGDGGPATSALLSSPAGLARDPSGNLYIADVGNRRVRKLAPDGTITTFAGTGVYGAGGDDGPAIDLDVTAPLLSSDAAGHLVMLNAQAGSWQQLGAVVQLPLAELYADPVSDRLRMSHDGYGLVLADNRWQHAAYAVPGPSPLAPAPLDGGIVAYETRAIGSSATAARSWRADAPTWEVTEASPAAGPAPGALLSYDWVRQAVVLVGGSTAGRRDTYLNRDAAWSLLAGAAPLPAGDPSALGFDPELPGMILVHAGRVFTLGSTASAWIDVGAVASVIGGTPRSFAYDPTSRVLFALSDAGQIWERRAGTWSLSPFALNIPGYRLVADERRGLVMALPLDGRDRRWFEYRGGWIEGGVLPREVRGTIASDPRHGRMVILGDGPPTEPSGYTFMLVRTSRSGQSDESCVEGEDVDGDGLIGCADDDCFWRCARCPLYTSCL